MNAIVHNEDGRDLAFRWESTVEAIGRAAWCECFGTDDVYVSFELARAVERGRLENIEYHYLIGERGGRTVAVLPCFRFRVSGTLLAPRPVQRMVQAIRRIAPGFLHFNLFEVGTPVATCRDQIGLRLIDPDERGHVLQRAKHEILRRARAANAGLVVVKEITTKELGLARRVFAPEFQIVETMPTSFVPVGGGEFPGYDARLKSDRRKKMRRSKERFTEAGLEWRTITDFAPLAEQMSALYLQVLERAETRFETLVPAFFREVARELSGRAFVLGAFEGDRMVAFELCLEDEGWLHPMYFGMDYGVRDRAMLYFAAIFRIIEECERRGHPVLQLGQTAYEAKSMIGARIARLYLGVYHFNPGVRWLLRLLSRRLFPAVAPPSHRPFRDDDLSRRILEARDVACE